MADVQKAHGMVQIANRLFEAMIEAGFNDQQIRIVLVLLRLTYGWNAKSVRMKEQDLARRCGTLGPNASRAGGSFRIALAGLLKNGVVVRLETEKRGVFLWGLNKDFETWGTYASSLSRLSAAWGDRPTRSRDDDRAVAAEVDRIRANNGRSVDAQPDETEEDNEEEIERKTNANDRPETGPDKWPGDRPHIEAGQKNEWTADGPVSGPLPVHIIDPKSLSGETYEAGKTLKDSSTPSGGKDLLPEQPSLSAKSGETAAVVDAINPSGNEPEHGGQPLTPLDPRSDEPEPPKSPPPGATSRARDLDAVREYARELNAIANAARNARWGEQPVGLNFVSAVKLAGDLVKLEVPIAFAKLVIESTCRDVKADDPISTVEYFRKPILKALAAVDRRPGDKTATGPETAGERSYAAGRAAFEQNR